MKAPTINLDGTGIVALTALGALGVLGVWLYSKRETIAKAAETALASVNPADSRNLAYRSVNSIGGAIAGDDNFSLGVAIYNLFNPEPEPKSSQTPDLTPQPDPYGVAPYFAP